MTALRDRFVAAYRAFREPDLISEPLDWSDFADFDGRKTRYAILWAWFENNQYRNIHNWAHAYKTEFGLYRYTRGIYNPAYRLATFWQTNLMGGLLDPAAGDGEQRPSALPIETAADMQEATDKALREAIAGLWRNSNWQSRKDIYTLWGAVMGDVGLAVVDDTARGRVYLEVVNPSIVKDLDIDAYGHVKGYVFEEERIDPEDPKGEKTVTYREECKRGDGDAVIYRLYRDDTPHAWPDTPGPEWEVGYGFVPFVFVNHYNVGLDYGWSEMHSGRAKFQEADDLASMLSDQVRKMVNSPWLLAGVDKPGTTPAATSRDSETYQESSAAVDRPAPGREEVPAFYGPPDAKAYPLVSNLDISATAEYLAGIIKEIERDYPELEANIHTASGDASGRALRVARQRAENKVIQRRVGYDNGLIMAQQMAIAIGGWRNYEGFSGFGLDSYSQGLLEHHIGERPVFDLDPLDESEIEKAEWEAVNEAVKAGIPLEFYLAEEKGWEQEKIDRLVMAMESQSFRGIDFDARPPELRPETAGGDESYQAGADGRAGGEIMQSEGGGDDLAPG